MFIELKTAPGVPTYMRIAQDIERAVEEKRLKKGDRLPTMRELSEELGVSKGTVKHAYDLLELSGVTEMTRGRGTFVAKEPPPELSGRCYAESAVERLTGELERTANTPDAQAVIRDLREYYTENLPGYLRVAYTAGSPEILNQITNSIVSLEGVEAKGFITEEILHRPHLLDDSFDIICAPKEDYERLLESVPSLKQMMISVPAVLSYKSALCMRQIDPHARVFVLCRSYNYFGHIILPELYERVNLSTAPVPIMSGAPLAESLREGCDVLIIAGDYPAGISREDFDEIGRFARSGGVVFVCEHRPPAESLERIAYFAGMKHTGV